ncbi:MAG: efflux transporter, family, subunit [Firmicutes bacterium]|nr:efflux transporter, family, subunit [Bacillota bacterium]
MQAIWKIIKRYKGWIIAVLILAVLVGGGVMYYKKTSAPATAIATVTVGRGDVLASVSATGTVAAVNSVAVASRVTGLISEVRVAENDIVKKGQVLFVLDDSAVRAQLAQYKATMDKTAAIYERSMKLAAIGGESEQQLESDRTDYLVAKSNYDNYGTQLGYYVITAPVDGMVIGTPTPAGETVVQGISSAQTILTIADMSIMQVKVLVDESDIGKVKVGQMATFTVDSHADKTFTGKVASISRDATTSSNVVYYPVYVRVDAPEGLLFPTMTARATINVGESKNVLVVPLSALRSDKTGQYVQVMANGKTENVPVTLGLRDDEKVEVLSGLNEGDVIVLPTKQTTTKSNQNQGPPPPM